MSFPPRMTFGMFMGPHHWPGENPTLSLERDLELVQWLDTLGFDEAWIGEHHSAGWEIITSPEIFIAFAAERTRHIRLGTGVVSLPYHHPLMVADRMVLLDHLTRGRVMFGVGPGALVTDAVMLGIDPESQRRRMDESLGVIMKLFTCTEPITHHADWFTLNDAMLQIRPYTQPHMPVAVAAVQSPAGMLLAGKHGAAVLSLSVPRSGDLSAKDFWSIAEQSAAEHGKTVRREDWRLVLPVHLAETRAEAIEQAREYAGRQQREYTERTVGHPTAVEGPPEYIIDTMVDRGLWIVGTPDDMIARMEQLDEMTGGYGGLVVFFGEWGTPQQVRRSYELIARYVMPRFQGSVANLQTSQAISMAQVDHLRTLRTAAIDRARRDYAETR